MNCENFKKWVHLNKTGELSEREQRLLEKHIEICLDCQNLVEEIKSKDDYIQRLKNMNPAIDYPGVLTSNIMQSITGQRKPNQLLMKFYKVFDLLFSYKLRFTGILILIALISLFSYQQIHILNKLNQMEQKVAAKLVENETAFKTPILINDRIIKELVPEGSEQVILNEESLGLIIESYKNLKTDHDKLLELIDNNMSLLERKLSKKDLEKLKQLVEEERLERNLPTDL